VAAETEIRWYCASCSDLVGVNDFASIPEDCIDCTFGSSGETLFEKMQNLMKESTDD